MSKNLSRHTKCFKIFLLYLCIYLPIQIKAQIPNQPKLVIGIVVDQMRYDYLFKFWNKYSDKGFKRLVREGFLCRDAHYNYMPTYTGPGHASIYTGATPSIHGIIANDWYEKNEKNEIYCVSDKNYETVGSTGKAGRMSPKNLQSSTIGDELRLWSNFKSKVIGISLKDRAAILPAGRAANAAFWFDATSGNFISSTYYMSQLPEWVSLFNQKKYADKYLSQAWNTLLPISSYVESSDDNSKYENPYKGEKTPTFPHDLAAIKVNDGELIRRTPFGNSILKDFAISCINAEKLGKGNFPDFLSISFSSTDYIGHQFGPSSIELEDTYLRLDQDISELLSFLDSYIGQNNILFFLTADHGGVYSGTQLDSAKLSNGNTDFKSIKSQLEQALENKYGKKESDWIASISNYQVFLNHALLISNNIPYSEFENFIVQYIEKLPGIARCYTEAEMRIPQNGLAANIQRGFYPKRSGDIIILTEPYYGELFSKGAMHSTTYTYDTHVPIILFGGAIPSGESYNYLEITDIAPTICNILGIEAPSGCTGKIINLKRVNSTNR